MKKQKRISGIIIKNGKLLLLKGKDHELIWTPGGKVEKDEIDEECLKRELKEEIDADFISMKFFKEYERVFFFNPKIRFREMAYIVEVKGKIKPKAEIDSLVWVSKKDYNNKKYDTRIEDHVILDLIKENIW